MDDRGKRPITRGDCEHVVRPCPWSECRYHLGVNPIASCALDVAEGGPHTLEELSQIMGVTRERVRQIEIAALRKIRDKRGATFLRD